MSICAPSVFWHFLFPVEPLIQKEKKMSNRRQSEWNDSFKVVAAVVVIVVVVVLLLFLGWVGGGRRVWLLWTRINKSQDWYSKATCTKSVNRSMNWWSAGRNTYTHTAIFGPALPLSSLWINPSYSGSWSCLFRFLVLSIQVPGPSIQVPGPAFLIQDPGPALPIHDPGPAFLIQVHGPARPIQVRGPAYSGSRSTHTI